jgi:hypothetical protein
MLFLNIGKLGDTFRKPVPDRISGTLGGIHDGPVIIDVNKFNDAPHKTGWNPRACHSAQDK